MSYPLCWTGRVKTNKPSNPDHHIWDNNGTFWCHYTVHEAGHTKRRVRAPLHTKDREEARVRRDELLKAVPNASIRFMPAREIIFCPERYAANLRALGVNL